MPAPAHDEKPIIGDSFLADFGLDRPRKAPAKPAARAAAARSVADELADELFEESFNLSEHVASRQSPSRGNDDVAGALFDDYRDASIRSEIASTGPRSAEPAPMNASLRSMLARQDVLRSMTSRSLPSRVHDRLPQVGDEIFGFRLKKPLGQGAFASVFLAEQTGLADRPVVVKTSDLTGSEPQTLAQLQHTNIVPIFSVHEDETADLRAVCMPYFGGASLSHVLKAVLEYNEHPTVGGLIADALERVGSPMPQPRSVDAQTTAGLANESSETGFKSLLRNYNYIEACGWIVARLADGLQHAHDRGVLHRDIKPSNALLTADGTPMLLDFNLSHDEQQSHAQVETTLGGTLAYMAPEHLKALHSRSAEMVKKVDARSDIYGLGMVLFELITGHSAFEEMASCAAVPILIEAMANERARSAPSLRVQRPDASWGFESIVRKCLNPDPDQRYQRAEQLAQDIDRLLAQQPLKHAPELSVRERLSKWFKRHPRVVPSTTIAALSLAVLAIANHSHSATQRRLEEASQRAFEAEGAEARELKARFERGVQQALCLSNTHSALQDHAARGATVCEETLALYGILERDDWLMQPTLQRLDPKERTEVAEDARELLLQLALARASGSEAELRTQSLKLLDRAATIDGLQPSAAVLLAEATLQRDAGAEDRAAQCEQAAAAIKPQSARDFYQLATTALQSARTDRHRVAIEHLRAAIKNDPRHYWSWMQKGLCHLEIGEQHQALSDFSVCIGLWPEFAWGFFNRAFALNQIGDKAGAIDDYSNAIERDPELLTAYHNRGVARLEMQQFAAALEDFDRLLHVGVPGTKIEITRQLAELQALRGQAFEGLERHAEADAAFAVAFEDPAALLPSVRQQMSCAYGFAVYRRLPELAEQAFRRVSKNDSLFPEAAYGRGMLAVERKEETAAVRFFRDAVAARPSFDEPRRFLAIVLARQGRLPEAVAAINESLTLNPNSGPAHYAAACVSALAAAQATEAEQARHAKLEALTLLNRALQLGYGKHAASDSDLSALHELPEFQNLFSQTP